MGRKAVCPVCCVMHVKEPSALVEKGFAPMFLVWLAVYCATALCKNFVSTLETITWCYVKRLGFIIQKCNPTYLLAGKYWILNCLERHWVTDMSAIRSHYYYYYLVIDGVYSVCLTVSKTQTQYVPSVNLLVRRRWNHPQNINLKTFYMIHLSISYFDTIVRFVIRFINYFGIN